MSKKKDVPIGTSAEALAKAFEIKKPEEKPPE